MSVIVKIIKTEERNAKAKTKALVENRDAIKAEAAEIAIIRQEYRGKDFAAAMAAQGFGELADRKNRNNLEATIWISTDEGAAKYDAWCEDENRALCETLRGIKKAATPKAERAPRQPQGEGEGENEAVEASADKAPRTCADILKNAFDQCRAAGISPDKFLDFVSSDQSMPVYDAAVNKAAA